MYQRQRKEAKSWDEKRRDAKRIERLLEEKLPEFAQLVKNFTPSLDDEEQNIEQQHNQLIIEIETAMSTFSELIDHMNEDLVSDHASSSTSQFAVVKRSREIYHDCKTQFQHTSAKFTQEKEKHALFQHRKNRNHLHHGSTNDEMDVLLRERNAVDTSRSLAQSIVGQALAAKSSLDRQRERFSTSRGRMTGLSNQFSTIHGIVESIRRKKMRHHTILALVLAALICFSLWWIVLSKT